MTAPARFAPLAERTILALGAAGDEAWRARATVRPAPLSPGQVGGGQLVPRTQATLVALAALAVATHWSTGARA